MVATKKQKYLGHDNMYSYRVFPENGNLSYICTVSRQIVFM